MDLVKVDWNSKMEVHVLMDLPMDLDDVDLGIGLIWMLFFD